MEELQSSKGKRVYALKPNAILCADFSKKYIHYLLSGLIKIRNGRTCEDNENQEFLKIVRFEVDMALVLSASGFAWSNALRCKLEREIDIKSPLKTPSYPPTASNLLHVYKHHNIINLGEKSGPVSLLPPVSRHLFPVGNQRNNSFEDLEKSKKACRRRKRKRTRIRGDEEEIGRRLRTLRKVLPGGDEMNVCQLLSQVESYVGCLELQVSILRTLVTIQ